MSTIRIITIILCFCTASLTAADIEFDRFVGGASIGYTPASHIEFDNTAHKTKDTYHFDIFFDAPLYRRIHIGLSVSNYHIDWDIPDTAFIQAIDKDLLDIGLNLKYHFNPDNGNWAIRSGGGIGYGEFRNSFKISKAKFLTYRLTTELMIETDIEVGPMLVIGYWGTISGKDRGFDVSIGPFYFVRLGLFF